MEAVTNLSHVKEETGMSEQINEISAALSKAQSELEGAKKDSSGYGYNYSDLASVISSAKPILAKHNLAIVQLIGEQSESQVSLTTILTHSSGQYFKSKATLPVIEMKGCNLAQGAGASLSYLRRYAYQAIIGQPSEDVDASSNGKAKQASDFKTKSSPKKEDKPKEEKRTRFKSAKPAGTL